MPTPPRHSWLSHLAVLCAWAALALVLVLVLAGARVAVPIIVQARPPGPAASLPVADPAARALQGFKGLARAATARRWRAGLRR